MQFNLTINCDSSAYGGDYVTSAELHLILERVADRVSDGIFAGYVEDSNGNIVGKFELVEE